MRRKLLALFTAALMWTAAVMSVMGDEPDDVDAQLSQAQEEVSDLTAKTKNMEVYIGELNDQLLKVNAEIESIDNEIDDVNAQIVSTQAALEEARANASEQYDSMQLRIQYMYETGTDNIFAMFAEAKSLSELLNQIDYVLELSSYDSDKQDALVAVSNEIKAKEDELDFELASLESLKQQNEEKQGEVMTLVSKAATELQDYNAQLEAAKDNVEEYEAAVAERDAWLAQLQAQAEAEAAAQAAAEAAAEESRLAAEAASKAAAEEAQRQAEQAAAIAAAAAATTTAAPTTSAPTTSAPTTAASTTAARATMAAASSSSSSSSGEYTDLDYLAAIIYCEVGSQGYEAELALGSEVMNRVNSPYYPNTVYGVITASGQYTPVRTGAWMVALANGASASAYSAASEVLAGNITIPYCHNNAYSAAMEAAHPGGVNIGGEYFY